MACGSRVSLLVSVVFYSTYLEVFWQWSRSSPCRRSSSEAKEICPQPIVLRWPDLDLPWHKACKSPSTTEYASLEKLLRRPKFQTFISFLLEHQGGANSFCSWRSHSLTESDCACITTVLGWEKGRHRSMGAQRREKSFPASLEDKTTSWE